MILAGTQIPAPAQNSFSILYVANINGTLENCRCGKEPLGGVDRLKSIIDQCRKTRPDLLVISGGDYFNPYSFLHLNRTMLRVLDLLKFDLFVPGDQEFSEGDLFTIQIHASLGNAWFLSNDQTTQNDGKTGWAHKYPITIYSYLSPACFTFIAKPANLVLDPEVEKFSDHGPGTFDVVVYHGFLEDAITVARNYRGIELILLGHDQYPDTRIVDGTIITGAGRDAEFVVLLDITLSGKKWNIEQEKIYLNASVTADEEVASLIRTYKQQIKTGSR